MLLRTKEPLLTLALFVIYIYLNTFYLRILIKYIPEIEEGISIKEFY